MKQLIGESWHINTNIQLTPKMQPKLVSTPLLYNRVKNRELLMKFPTINYAPGHVLCNGYTYLYCNSNCS